MHVVIYDLTVGDGHAVTLTPPQEVILGIAEGAFTVKAHANT